MGRSVSWYLLVALALGAILVGAAWAQQPAPTPKPPPDRQGACDETAKAHQLTGTARSKFMADCLADPSGAGASPDKAKACAAKADAQKLVGDARDGFVRGCLEGS